MYCDLWLQYIQVRKLFKGGNYSRAETIRGNTVFQRQKVISSEYWRSGQIGLSEPKRKIKAPLPRSKPDQIIIPKVTKSKFLLGLFELL